LAYTSHADVSGNEPPTFVVVGDRDGIAPPSAMERRVRALQQVGVSVEYHLIPGVAHGFGTGLGTPAEGWVDDAVAFWKAAM
jgi:acetyl esterase/lipase